jgi:hypothetical protein
MKPDARSEGGRWLAQAENDLGLRRARVAGGLLHPNSLPGGIPAEAFARGDAERALAMARGVIAAIKRRFP